jgi:plastocyanin
VAGQLSYNLAAEGVDGELAVARRIGPLRVIGVGRTLKDPLGSGRRYAFGGGGTLRISRFFALAGDVATLTEREEGEEVAWSAGVHLAIPGTPHTLSIHTANTNAYTLQGVSRGEKTRRYGFEFTIPLTLNRWFGRGAQGHPAVASQAPELAPADSGATPTGAVAHAGMRNLAFVPGTVEIAAGTTVEWLNNDPLSHSVTADDNSFSSGLIAPGRKWRHTFTTPGTYTYHCTPHPFMKGTVVVK